MQYGLAIEVGEHMTPHEVAAVLLEAAKEAAQHLQDNGHLGVDEDYHVGKSQVFFRVE